MNLDELFSLPSQFHSDGAVGGLDGFFLAAESAAFNPF